MVATVKLNKMLQLYKQRPEDTELLRNIIEFFGILRSVSLNPDIRESTGYHIQNKKDLYDNVRTGKISIPGSWTKNFKKLLYILKIEYENS